MTVHDVGYRGWRGAKTLPLTRPIAIARSGVSLILKGRWLRLLLMLGWLPALFPAIIIATFEYATQSNPEAVTGVLQSLPIGRPELAAEYFQDPSSVRHEIWSTAILTYFRYPQLVCMVVLIGVITPRLVSYDLRSRAYLQYFSRPLSPFEYILGKSAVVWFFLFAIATVPALLIYLMGIMLSPELGVVLATWDLPFRIIAASLVLMVPTTTLAVCYSSFTTESRYATFAWFATWSMGFVAYSILTFALAEFSNFNENGERVLNQDRWRLLSPYHTLGKVQQWVFDLQDTAGSAIPAIIALLMVTVVGTWLIRRMLLRRLRV